MDIRVINGEGELINVSRMHITVNNQYLIALTEDMKSTITIERCKNEEEARQFLRWIKEAIKCAMEEESENVLIDLEPAQESEEKCCGKCESCKKNDGGLFVNKIYSHPYYD